MVIMDDVRTGIVTAAERVFDRHGFAGSGVDRLTDAAKVSSRTLYKHLGSKNALISAVLDSRRERFFTAHNADSVDALEQWIDTEGARGCFFLRAEGEGIDDGGAVTAAVSAYRADLGELTRRIVMTETGRDDDALAEQLLVLFEGATSAASYRGRGAIAAARTAAAGLMSHGNADRGVNA